MNITGFKTFEDKISSFIKTPLYKWFERHFFLLAILLFGLLLRIYKIKGKELWYDEVLDIIQSQKSVVEIFQDVKLTPLHYLFGHFFYLLNDSVISLRIPSIIFGVLSIYALYKLAIKLTNKDVALISSLLLAISPMAVEFSQQILHYSSFLFFTIVSLYFYVDLLFEKKWKISTVLLFILFTICNLTSHISAFIIVALEGLFFITYHLFFFKKSWQKLIALTRSKQGLALLAAVGVVLVLILIKTDYVRVMHAFTTFDIHRPIKLGYSLSTQLNNEYITYLSTEFVLLMFAWLGLGTGFVLYVYLGLFILGTLFLVKRPQLLMLSLFWIFFPLILLFTIKIDHWFEEKYLIFILPIYLFVISYGLVSFSNLFSKTTKKLIFLHVIPLLILLAYQPIRTRTTYGFSVGPETPYSWQQVLAQVPDDSAVFSLDDLYFRIHLGEKGRNSKWYTDAFLGNTTVEQYQQLVSDSRDFYYISIPDINNLKVSSIVDSNQKGIYGNINLYKVKFFRKTPIDFNEVYIDNFIKFDYLKSASNWNNISISFPDVRLSEGPIYLVPTSTTDPFVEYKFNFSKNPRNLKLKVGYVSVYPENLVETSVTTKGQTTVLQTPLQELKDEKYVEQIFDLNTLLVNKDLALRFNFKTNDEGLKNLNLGIRYFMLYEDDKANDTVQLEKVDEHYEYHAKLEMDQKNVWLKDSLLNFGWFQNKDGLLYKAVGGVKNPLIYKFALPQGLEQGQLLFKTYTFENGLSFELSNDGVNYQTLAEIENQNKFLTHEMSIPSELIKAKQILYLRVNSKDSNDHAVLRTFTLKVQ